MSEYGIRTLHENLQRKLADYIKAQYFAKNEHILNTLLADDSFLGDIAQIPYIESGKKYRKSDNGFKDSKINDLNKKILEDMISMNLGVFKTPFIHQIKAVEYFQNGKDILVTTGTGSGKTECFLWNLYCQLIGEASMSETWDTEGIRFLLLYPMNALVSDQLGRIRQVIGNEKFTDLIRKNNRTARKPKFGMYTGRTSYAGEDKPEENKQLGRILKREFTPEKINALKEINRVPSKKINQFIDSLLEGIQTTSPDDCELFTRYEMQRCCPDILITNYCMLEYMLIRTIEQPIWNKTREWLNASDNNKLTIVLDEAHMYKGSAGGEVSLLIRRLLQHLGINRDKVRFIMTTASIPANKDEAVMKFACDLSCTDIKHNSFEIIREEYEEFTLNKQGDTHDVEVLCNLDYDSLLSDDDCLKNEIEKLYSSYNWKRENENIKYDLYIHLSKFPVMHELLNICMSQALPFSKISEKLFSAGSIKDKEYATEILLALGSLAKDSENHVLLPSKLHLMFRGLNGLYACINNNCPSAYKSESLNVGRVQTEDSLVCKDCGCRMFELTNDRRCGTVFINSYIKKEEFCAHSYKCMIWQKNNNMVADLINIPLWIVPNGRNENDIFKETSVGKKRSKDTARQSSNFAYVDSKTGMLCFDDSFENVSGYTKVLVPVSEKSSSPFSVCPNCGRNFNKLTSFASKGNEPFDNLVQEQFESQHAVDSNLKNGGRKVLLFSDSRQKAAKLAKDITRNSDEEASRQAIMLSLKILEEEYGSGNVPIDLLYSVFLYCILKDDIYFYYAEETRNFREHLYKLNETRSQKEKRGKQLNFKKISNDFSHEIPELFYKFVLKSVCDNYNSLQYLCLAELMLLEEDDDIEDEIYEISNATDISEEEIRNIYNAIIQRVSVDDVALFSELDDEVRKGIMRYKREYFGIDLNEKDGTIKLPQHIHNVLLKNNISEEKINLLRENFNKYITFSKSNKNNKKYLMSSKLTLKSNISDEATWYHCDRCAGNASYSIFGFCIHCGSDKIHVIKKSEMKRYDFWRKPILDVINGKSIGNIVTEEHTAQLSYKDKREKMWSTTEEYEMRFRNIILDESQRPIDILSCTTTMEVGIDIGSLIAVGLRNIPPLRENYQQRAGRAGRKGSALSSIVTYTENGPHDAWYYSHPNEIISGEPRTPWIDVNNETLINRHINMIVFKTYFLKYKSSIDQITVKNFVDSTSLLNYNRFKESLDDIFDELKKYNNTVIPSNLNFEWNVYKEEFMSMLDDLANDIKNNPIKYRKYLEDSSEENNDETMNLMDVLFSKGLLPTYSFPRDVVPFWIEDDKGKVVQSPERSIDIALSEYAPGRMLVVNKKTYVSGGLYDHYTKRTSEYKYNAAQPWLSMTEYRSNVFKCKNNTCSWFGELSGQSDKCPLCGDALEAHMVIKPWGFTAKNGAEIPETREDQEYSVSNAPSYSSFPDTNKMDSISSHMRIEARSGQNITIVNWGPENGEFRICDKCGAAAPWGISNEEMKEIKRPYKAYMYRDDTQKCSHSWIKASLGYTFLTDMLVLEIHLDENIFDISEKNRNIWLTPALVTFKEAFALSACKVMDIEFNDIKSGYRLRNSNGKLYADVFLYDNLSSGAGYSNHAIEVIDDIFKDMKIRLSECNCDTSCPKCVRHYWNQSEHKNLNRKCGLELLDWAYFGIENRKVSEDVVIKCTEIISNTLRAFDVECLIEHSDNQWYITVNGKTKKLIIQSAMYIDKANQMNDTIFLQDRICLEAPPLIYNKVMTQI